MACGETTLRFRCANPWGALHSSALTGARAAHPQAICELYDRPAEIYAFDPVEGVRTLRVFHSTRSDARPPMRLSYFGGGHYDSIVGPGWDVNLLREPPGVVEARRVAVSRSVAAAVAAGGDPGAPRAAVSAEEAAVAAALAASRVEFDEAAENIDAALLSIEIASSQAEGGGAAAPVGGAASAAAPAPATLEAQILQQVLRSSALDDESMTMQALVMEQTRAAAEAEALRAAVAASLADAGGGAAQGSAGAPTSAALAVQGDDRDLRDAMALSLSSAQPVGELDALYNLGLDLSEDQQLARLLQMSRDEDVQRARRTQLAQADMQAQLQQHAGPMHPDNVAAAASGGGAASALAGRGGAASSAPSRPVAPTPALQPEPGPPPDADFDADEDAMLQAALAASLGPHP